MENELPQVQAVRPVNKNGLDSVFNSTPAPKIIYFDCHIDPTTKKAFVLWDDIRLAFSDALYARHMDKVVPFMKGMDFMPLQPLRIAAMPDVVLDLVLDAPLMNTEAATSQVSSQTPIQDTTKETTVQDEATVRTGASAHFSASATINETKAITIGRNPAFGLVEAAMQNYNHIDNPAFGPQPRAPQNIPIYDNNHSSEDESTNSLVLIQEQPAYRIYRYKNAFIPELELPIDKEEIYVMSREM
ncbi:MAG: hypothetical protein J3R72DRAFT_478095 [Linnemannia gamsii]|nr:MAG: hypothetical protein J3R72DRAFT_478095 [Linnemannia gamsii]